MSDLVRNPKDRFSHKVAHILAVLVKVEGQGFHHFRSDYNSLDGLHISCE